MEVDSTPSELTVTMDLSGVAYYDCKPRALMTSLLTEVPKSDWHQGATPASGANGTGSLRGTDQDPWDETLAAIDDLRELGDNWDGLGAAGPSDELVDSASKLAGVFRDRQMDAPARVVASPEGTVILEWQWQDGDYAEVEVVRPFFAEVMWIAKEQPPEHWTLPTE